MTRIIIAASGGQGKWNRHLGVTSHFAPLTRHDDQPLIERTIEQIERRGYKPHILIPPNVQYARLNGIKHVILQPKQSEYDASRPFWAPEGRTILLLGDVFFSEMALKKILQFKHHQYMVFGRRGASRITGTPYGEIFAASWWDTDHDQMDEHLEIVHQTRAEGTVTRPPGWMLLRSWQGTDLSKHFAGRRYFRNINDETDDIDFPVDYERHPATREEKVHNGQRVLRLPAVG